MISPDRSHHRPSQATTLGWCMQALRISGRLVRPPACLLARLLFTTFVLSHCTALHRTAPHSPLVTARLLPRYAFLSLFESRAPPPPPTPLRRSSWCYCGTRLDQPRSNYILPYPFVHPTFFLFVPFSRPHLHDTLFLPTIRSIRRGT